MKYSCLVEQKKSHQVVAAPPTHILPRLLIEFVNGRANGAKAGLRDAADGKDAVQQLPVVDLADGVNVTKEFEKKGETQERWPETPLECRRPTWLPLP
jgi:hypothetical protein